MSDKTLNNTQKHFICKKLAKFNPHRKIAQDMLKEFPKLQLNEEQLLVRVKYYAFHKKAAKWRDRIEIYRFILNYKLDERFALTNRFERLRQLEKILSEAMTPRLQRIVSWEDGVDKDGKSITHKKKILQTGHCNRCKSNIHDQRGSRSHHKEREFAIFRIQ